MALYEKKESTVREAKYSVEISRDQIFNRRRELDVYDCMIGGVKMVLDGTVHFISQDGERVSGASNMPYPFALKCENNGYPYVNEQTGEIVKDPKDEDGELLQGIVSRYHFITNILPFDKTKVYVKKMEVITEMELSFIKEADLNGEFNL